MLGFGKPKVIDPYNTMGNSPARSGNPGSRDNSTDGLARRYGITHDAAVKVSDLIREIEANGGPTSSGADGIRNRIYRLIDDPKNWDADT